MSAPADVIRVQAIESEHFPINLGDAAGSLRGEEFFSADAVERLLLRKSLAVLDYFIPYGIISGRSPFSYFLIVTSFILFPPGDFQRKALSPWSRAIISPNGASGVLFQRLPLIFTAEQQSPRRMRPHLKSMPSILRVLIILLFVIFKPETLSARSI